MLVANPTSLNLRPGVARPLSCPVVGYTGRRYCPGGMELGGCCAGLGVGAGPVVVVCSSLCVAGTDGSASSSAGTGSLARRRKEPSRCLCSHAFWRTLSSFRFFSSSWGKIKILIVIIVTCKSNKKNSNFLSWDAVFRHYFLYEIQMPVHVPLFAVCRLLMWHDTEGRLSWSPWSLCPSQRGTGRGPEERSHNSPSVARQVVDKTEKFTMQLWFQ